MIVKDKIGNTSTLTVSLPLTEDVSEDLARKGKECIAEGNAQLVIDLHQVPVIDSSGLETLLDLQDLCLRKGGALKLAAPTQVCADILYATGLEEMIEVFDSTVGAVGSYSS